MSITAFAISSSPCSFSTKIFKHCCPKLLVAHNYKPLKVDTSCRASNDGVVFDDKAYESERLRLDAKARQSMAEASDREVQDEDDPKAWKWVIRKRVWDLMEAQNIAQNPRPVHHRIPNFVGASKAADKVMMIWVIHFGFTFILFLCVCVCKLSVCVCVSVSVRLYVSVCTRDCWCLCVSMCECVRTCACVSVCEGVCVCERLCARECLCVYVFVWMCEGVCACV